MKKYKGLLDIDLVCSFGEDLPGFSLKTMVGTPALSVFRELHFIHLLNINGQRGKNIRFTLEFKEFIASEIGVSVRTVGGWMNKLIRKGYITQSGGCYQFGEELRRTFKKGW